MLKEYYYLKLNLLYLRRKSHILKMKFVSEGDENHLIQALVGLFLILFSNGLVIIGILCNIHFLLIPWLIIYLSGMHCMEFVHVKYCYCSGAVIMTLFSLMNLAYNFVLHSLLSLLVCIGFILLWIIVNQIREDIRNNSKSIPKDIHNDITYLEEEED